MKKLAIIVVFAMALVSLTACSDAVLQTETSDTVNSISEVTITAQTTTEATTTTFATTTEVTTTTKATTTPVTTTEVTTTAEVTTTPATTTEITTTTQATTTETTTAISTEKTSITTSETTAKTEKKQTSSEFDNEYLSSNGTILLVDMTSLVYNNNMASLTIQGKPNTEYSIFVYYSSGTSEADGLERKTSDSNGYVTWEWKVGPRTKAGSHRIVISDASDSLTVYFTTEK